MPRPTRPAVRRTVALVPVALLSVAATVGLASASGPGLAAPAPAAPVRALPDGTSLPAQAIEAPASVSGSEDLTGSVDGPGISGDVEQIVATSSTNGIPSAALAAYQRAETVINAADESCHLTWQLVAAIGRVESDHGRYGGNALDADGVATPGIYGPALNGKGNVSLIRDTDAGQYDDDLTYDRAVGPLQFIPSTWSVVGVDADNDGVRNPQDVDDAALATAVYLCSGTGPTGDLATLPGQKAAVFRYNHSRSYVDLVLSVMDAYLAGDFTSVPNGITAAGYLEPKPGRVAPTGHSTASTGGEPTTGDDTTPGAGGTTEDPTTDPAAEPDGEDPTTPPVTLPEVTVPALPPTGVGPLDELLTVAQAVVRCALAGHVDDLLRDDDAFDTCVADLVDARPRRP